MWAELIEQPSTCCFMDVVGFLNIGSFFGTVCTKLCNSLGSLFGPKIGGNHQIRNTLSELPAIRMLTRKR